MAKATHLTGLDMQAPTGENARTAVQVRLEEMYSWSQYVDNPFYIRELHNLRIAAKRLRYTLELFASVLPEAVAARAKDVEQIQEMLGALHDSDVSIALLRLCLGGEDSGTGYEEALTKASQTNGDFALNPDLVKLLIDPARTPDVQERQGLEMLVRSLEQEREKQYSEFRQYWYSLQARDFHHEVLQALST